MNWPATLANVLWVSGNIPARWTFQRALQDPRAIQTKLLRRLLTRHANCAYGRKHRFDQIQDYASFARSVPLVDYENLAPWIDRIRAGEPNVLTADRVTHLIPTSGSTGARKLIPFTMGLQKQFNAAIGPWIADLARQHPGLLFGPAYWSITPALTQAEDATSAVPVGFADDASYLGGAKAWLARAAMAVPVDVSQVTDADDFRVRTLLCLLLQRDLRLISIWHPSFLTLLLDSLPPHGLRLMEELHRMNPRRAREVERADWRRPATLWPRLKVISCWGDGHAAGAMEELHRRFPGVAIQAKGLLATEAFVTIPFEDAHPVAVGSHFFEFIDETNQPRLVQELRVGERYEVVVTTAGGLWRYRLGDQVEVTGFLERTPSLRFLGRRGGVSDRFGEKLGESFVADVLRRLFENASQQPRFAMLAPENREEDWRYTLYLETNTPIASGLPRQLDQALSENPHYAHCRNLGQLHDPRVFVIAEAAYPKFTQRLMTRGQRLGDIKPTALSPLDGWSQVFVGTWFNPSRHDQPSNVTAR